MNQFKERVGKKRPADNGRFGASGGVARLTLCVEQPLPLSSKPQWKPPPLRQAAGTLCATCDSAVDSDR